MKLESLKSSKFEALTESGMKLIVGGAGDWQPTEGRTYGTGKTKVVNGVTYYSVHSYRSDEMNCRDFAHCDYRYYGESDGWSITQP